MSAVRTWLGPGATRTEDACLSGPTRIDGHWTGELTCDDFVEIGPLGLVEGALTGAQILVYGEVRGSLIATERITLTETAVVTGSLMTPWLDAQLGAQITGQVTVRPDALTSPG